MIILDDKGKKQENFNPASPDKQKILLFTNWATQLRKHDISIKLYMIKVQKPDSAAVYIIGHLLRVMILKCYTYTNYVSYNLEICTLTCELTV